jgi:MFS family permease
VLRAIRGIPLVAWALFAILPLLQQVLMATAPVVPELREAFDLSYVALGLFLSVSHIVRLICDLPAGEVATRFDSRRLLWICAVVALVASVLGAIATTYWELLLSRGLIGAASAVNQAVVLAWLVSIATVRNRGLVMGLSEAAFSTVATFSPPIAGLLATQVGWRSPFILGIIAAVITLILGLVATRGVEPPEGSMGHSSRSAKQPTGSEEGATAPGHPSFRTLLPMGGGVLITAYAATFAIFFGRHAFNQTYLPVVGGDQLGLSPPVLGTAFGVLAMSSTVVTIGGAVLADRVGRAKFALPSLLLLFGAQASFLLVHDTSTFLIFFIVQVVGSAGYALPTSLVGDALPPIYRALGMAGYRVVADVAAVVGPLVAGLALDYLGARGPLFVVLAVTALCVLLSVASLGAGRHTGAAATTS